MLRSWRRTERFYYLSYCYVDHDQVVDKSASVHQSMAILLELLVLNLIEDNFSKREYMDKSKYLPHR